MTDDTYSGWQISSPNESDRGVWSASRQGVDPLTANTQSGLMALINITNRIEGLEEAESPNRIENLDDR